VPEKLETMNRGLRTLHFYQLDYSPFDFTTIVGGTQDNGSWERGDGPGSGTNGYDSATLPPAGVGIDTDEFPSERECLGRGRGDDDDDDDNGNRSGHRGEQVWVNTNIADGGHNNFDVADPSFRMTAWQVGQIQINFNKLDQVGQTWISDTLWVIYGGEAVGFIAAAITDPVQAGWMWTGRQHVFRADNYGINPTFGKAKVLEDCNVWTGDFDLDDDGVYEPLVDICDSWKPLGNPGAAGQLTGATYGADRQGGIVNLVERTKADTSTLWTATSAGRIFVSKNADAADPADVVFNRIDNTSPAAPERWPSAIYVDPADGNHAWVVYSGFSAKTPATPGHVFEVRYDEATKKATFTSLDGFGPNGFGDIPALGVVVDGKGTVYVSTDYGVLALRKAQGWKNASPGLPRMAVPDLMYVPERNVIYAATHGQGVWQLDLR
jgi:hypothetical protein